MNTAFLRSEFVALGTDICARGLSPSDQAGQSPQSLCFCCLFPSRMVSGIYLSVRLAESQSVIMVNKTCWSSYEEERSNYNCLKQS